MPLPRNVRPNPYQPLANEQWSATARSQYITPHQGLNPRSVVGHPSMVARQGLTADDIAYGQMPVQDGVRATNWEAAANARAAEASQTLQLHGMLGLAYGRRSGVATRALRVRKMPVGAVVAEYGTRGVGNAYLPASSMNPGPAHFRGFRGLTELLPSYSGEQGVAACAAFDDMDLLAAVAAMMATEIDPKSPTAWDPIGVVFGDQQAACAIVLGSEAYKETATQAALGNWTQDAALTDLLRPELSYANVIILAMLYKATGGDKDAAVRALKAGKTMSEKGWWEKDKWEFKWKYLSGYKLWYTNPLYLGGGAVGGLLLYSFAKKKKGRR